VEGNLGSEQGTVLLVVVLCIRNILFSTLILILIRISFSTTLDICKSAKTLSNKIYVVFALTCFLLPSWNKYMTSCKVHRCVHCNASKISKTWRLHYFRACSCSSPVGTPLINQNVFSVKLVPTTDSCSDVSIHLKHFLCLFSSPYLANVLWARQGHTSTLYKLLFYELVVSLLRQMMFCDACVRTRVVQKFTVKKSFLCNWIRFRSYLSETE
jgi:hypothetical protein